MDEHDKVGPPRPGAEDRAAGISPVRAFFLLAAIATAVPLGVFATREEAEPAEPPGAVRSPDYSLTDTEAIAEFERLSDTLDSAMEQRDVTLIKEFAAPDAAPGIRRVESEIKTLISDGVLYKTTQTRRSLDVLENSPTEVHLREVVEKTPRFIDEDSGKNLALDEAAEEQTILWVIRLYGSDWKIQSATITATGPAKEASR